MAETLPPDSQVADLLRRLDDLLAEATRLRDDIETAMQARIDSPFWPERRRRRLPITQERRQP